MAQTGLFAGIDKGLDQGIDLAMKKFQLDQAQSRFNAEMAMNQQKINMAKSEWDQQFQETKKRNLINEIQEMAKIPGAGQEYLAGLNEKLMEATGGEMALPTQTIPLPEGVMGPLESRFISQPTPEEALRSKLNVEFPYKIALEKSKNKTGTPSSLKKMIDEREALIASGVPMNDPRIEAYDNKISGTEIDLDEMTQEEIDVMGAWFNLTGKVPSLGRGKQATKARMAIVKSAAKQALGSDIPGDDPKSTKTPSEAALSAITAQADTKAIQGSMNFLEKQLASMGSFVSNLENQVERVKELSNDLKTFDTRLLNIPLRTLRGRIQGSPLQAKYDLYLSEIESEIGKLATGSTASVAELSTSAQERWAKIHDKNLSIQDMIQLLDETKEAARIRVESVDNQLNKTREKMRTRSTPKDTSKSKFKIISVE